MAPFLLVTKSSPPSGGLRKKYMSSFALANLLQKANSGSSWRLSSEQFGGTECSVVYQSQVHEAFLWAIFAPAGHRLNVFLRRRAPADLSIAFPPSC